ncbi:ACT domain-containing protein [Neolewinella sp.]|uniref:ACT domain-containing protein n=1 Tax=Neolewinella sp. TaxID=2993543 RepID=UPI003B5227AC
MSDHAILLIHCPDQPGLVAQVTEFVHKNRGNILNLDQHVDRSAERFFMRIEWDLEGFLIPRETADLDEGPIIAQAVEPVSHHHDVEDLKRIGRDVEKRVLARAVYLQLRHLILPFGNRTIIFN